MREYYYKNICKTVLLFIAGGAVVIIAASPFNGWIGFIIGYIYGYNFTDYIKPKSWVCTRIIPQ